MSKRNSKKNVPVLDSTTPQIVRQPVSFRPIAMTATQSENPTVIAHYEACLPNGRICEVKLQLNLASITWDGTLDELGQPQLQTNVGCAVQAQWKNGEAKMPEAPSSKMLC